MTSEEEVEGGGEAPLALPLRFLSSPLALHIIQLFLCHQVQKFVSSSSTFPSQSSFKSEVRQHILLNFPNLIIYQYHIKLGIGT